MVKREKSNYVIQSVSHAFDVLEQFRGDVVELGVTELSKKLKLHKNNVFRLLATLESRGYIEQNKATENYHLGLKSLELGQTFIKQMGLLRQARPLLEKLSEDSGETAYIAVMRNLDVTYLDVVESSQTVRVASRIGLRLPTYCTAVGKVQIAFKPEEEIKKFLPDKLDKLTGATITDEKKLLTHLKQVEDCGFAVDNEEFEDGVKCVGAPIRDYTGHVVAGISISGPTMRMTSDKIEKKLIQLVKQTGDEISQRLGYESSQA